MAMGTKASLPRYWGSEVNDHPILKTGAVTSIVLLVVALLLQALYPEVLKLPAQWLWVALTPTVVAVIAGRYISKFTAGSSGVVVEIDEKLRALPEAPRTTATDPHAVTGPAPASGMVRELSVAEWQELQRREVSRTDGLFLVHVYKAFPSERKTYEIFMYVVKHESMSTYPDTELPEVEQAEFYFGPSWGNRVFRFSNTPHDLLGVKTSAVGTFLAVCRITFRDPSREPVILHRYIDYEVFQRQEWHSRA